MRRLVLIAAAAAALAAPGTALGGGMGAWVLSGPARDIESGEVWVAQMRVVGCIGNPVDAVPTLTIVSQAGQQLTFRGRRTANGKYTARVTFPSAGRWSYRVSVGGIGEFEKRGPFVVAPAQKPSRLLAALPPLGAALLVLGTGALLRRRRA
jgi:hypothetical protein